MAARPRVCHDDGCGGVGMARRVGADHYQKALFVGQARYSSCALVLSPSTRADQSRAGGAPSLLDSWARSPG